MRKEVIDLKLNWTKILSGLALGASALSMLLDAIAQQQEIKDAAKEAVKEYLEDK
jgi:hypothetical protein